MTLETTTQSSAQPTEEAPVLLEVKNLKKHFPVKKGFIFTKVVGNVKRP